MIATDISAGILAGGQSTRFGSPKALHIISGESMLKHAITVAEQISDEIVLSTGSNMELRDISLPCVRDSVGNCGPISGLHALLKHIQSPWLAVLPCDMPLLRAEIYHFLMAQRTGDHPVFALSARGPQPLVAIWPKSALATVEKKIREERYSLLKLGMALGSRHIDIPNTLTDNQRAFLNINHRSDLRKLPLS